MYEHEETLKLWCGRVKLAKRFQDEHGNASEPRGGRRWENNRKALAGDFNSRAELGEEAIDVNLVRSSLKITLPPLTMANPHVAVNPTKAQTDDGGDNIVKSEKTEVELNYWMRELNVRGEVRKALIDAEVTNHGYIYVGRTKSRGDAYDVKSGERRENSPNVKFRAPFVKRHNPKMVLVPPGYWELEDCPWVDLVWLQPLRHVVAKFGLEDKKDDIPTETMFEGDAGPNDGQEITDYLDCDDAKLVRVHNVWDKETSKVYCFIEGYDEFLEEPKPWPWDTEGFPLVHYSPEKIQDDYYGTPPLTYVMPQQKELNAARTSIRRRYNRSKAHIFVGADVPDEVVANYKKAEDGEMQKVDTDKPLNQVIFTDPGLPPDQHGMLYAQIVQSDYMQQSGVSAEQRGSGDPNVDSATSSANIQRNVDIRNSERGDGVRDIYLNIARKLWMILKQFPDEERTRMIAGPLAGKFAEIKIKKGDLDGEFEFDLNISAMLADIPATRQQRAALNYKMLRNDPLVNPEWLVMEWLRSQNVLEPEKALLNLRSPDQEMQMFLTGLPVEAHERDNHEQHLSAHDQQSDMLAEALEQAAARGQDQMEKIQLALALLTSHVQDHVRKVKQLTGGPGAKPQGQSVDPNGAKSDIRAIQGNETEAELGGQPLVPGGVG